LPGTQRTILVSGLEACLEVMKPQEAEDFLRSKIKELILEFQSHWDAGLVFGFGCSANHFRVDTFDAVLFKCPGGQEVKLSDGLWNGAARHDMCKLMVTNSQTDRQELGGFYVRRLS